MKTSQGSYPSLPSFAKVLLTVQKFFFAAILAGIFLCLLYAASRPKEPIYQGKKLTEWANEIDQSDFYRKPGEWTEATEKNAPAIAAIQHIGTNALPTALNLLSAQDSWFKNKLEEWAERYNDSDWPKQRWHPMNIKSAAEKKYEGVNIIWALGDAAAPAIPSLIKLLQIPNAEIAENVMEALPGAGTNTIPPLTELLRSSDERLRVRAAIVLGEFKSQGRAVIPVLLQSLDDSSLNLTTRIRVIHALRKIHEDASVVVPVIVRHIETETNWLIQVNYFMTLGDFGTNAKSAIPVLTKILESNSPSFYLLPRQTALMALRKIDPEAAQPFLNQLQSLKTNSP